MVTPPASIGSESEPRAELEQVGEIAVELRRFRCRSPRPAACRPCRCAAARGRRRRSPSVAAAGPGRSTTARWRAAGRVRAARRTRAPRLRAARARAPARPGRAGCRATGRLLGARPAARHRRGQGRPRRCTARPSGPDGTAIRRAGQCRCRARPGFAAVERQRGGGDVARSQPIAVGGRGDDLGRREPADQHGIAVEQRGRSSSQAISAISSSRAAGQQPPGEAGDGRVARGMGVGDPRLAADRRGELAGDHRDDEQDDDRDDVGGAVDPEGVDRRGEEEIVGERGRDAGEQAPGPGPTSAAAASTAGR